MPYFSRIDCFPCCFFNFCLIIREGCKKANPPRPFPYQHPSTIKAQDEWVWPRDDLCLYFHLYLYLYLYYHHHPSTIKTEDGWLTHESGKGYGTLEQPINHDYHSHMGAFSCYKVSVEHFLFWTRKQDPVHESANFRQLRQELLLQLNVLKTSRF